MLPLSFDKGDKKAFSYNKEKSYLNWGYYCHAYGNFWEGLLVYWYTGKWKYELNFILYFHLFGMIHLFNIVTFFLEVEFVNLFKEVLWICHAWTVPKLIRWPRTSSWLCVLSSSLSSLFLWFSFSVFFFSHSSVLDGDHWAINWKRHKKDLKQWMMFSFLALWQQDGEQDGFYPFCSARAYTMLWFGHFHRSWQMEWKN